MTRAAFAYYQKMLTGEPPEPMYRIVKSDDPRLPEDTDVSAFRLHEKGIPLPLTPTYRTWLRMKQP